jgi:hypothetical protein
MSSGQARLPRSPFQPAAHQADEMRYIHWLGDVFGCAGSDRLRPVALHGLRGHHDIHQYQRDVVFAIQDFYSLPAVLRGRIARVSQPASSVSTADTQNDRIDADIQLAGVKPMSFPKDVHADAHQDTYPGLMSW